MLSKISTNSALRTTLSNQARRQMGLLAPLIGSSPNQNGLDEQFAGTPELVPLEIPAPTTSSGTLENGLNYLSEDSRSPLATFSINIGVGTRDTTLATSGTALLLKHLSLSTTANRSTLRIDRELEEVGASISTSVSRETLTIQGSVQAQYANQVLEILGDSITNPAIKNHEVQRVLQTAQNDVSGNGEAALSDAIHAAAFYDSLTLGLPIYGSLAGANRTSVVELAQSAFVGSNINLVGTGVDHDQFSHAANDFFSGVASGSHTRAASEYVGGEVRVARGGVTEVAVALSTAGASPAVAAVLANVFGSANRRPARRIGGRSGGRAAHVSISFLWKLDIIESCY